ncbi:MAG: hypothetical protein K2N85_07860 [Lachnospiraceae bacterium]|nr:hypothetical protein [Lachnospiraceae bacterium]
MKYTISRESILGFLIFIIGVCFTIQGIIIRYNLSNISESYREYEIKNGRYIECDITKERLIGSYYTENNGKIKYGPYCGTDAISSDSTYIVAINEDSEYYVPLIVTREYQKDFKEMVNSDDTYHMVGKFEKFRSFLSYDLVAECLGTNDKSKINQMVSASHQIKVVDLDDERRELYKGLLFLTVGAFILYVSVSRENRKRNIDT